MTEVNAAQVTNPGSRNKTPAPRQGSPVPSDTSAGSRVSSTGRTVRFQDQGSQGSQSSNQAYGSSSRTRWSGNQSPQGSSNGPRPWMDRRQQGQETPRSQPPSSGSGWTCRQGGPRFPPPQSDGQWTSGQSGPRFCPPAPGNSGNWRPGWRSPSRDRDGQSPVQQQDSPGRRRWSRGSVDQQPIGTADMPPPRRSNCYVCGNPRCHSDFHTVIAMSSQPPPVTRCYVCGQLGCHSSRHREYDRPPTPNAPSPQESRPATGTMSPPLNYLRGPQQGDRAPQY